MQSNASSDEYKNASAELEGSPIIIRPKRRRTANMESSPSKVSDLNEEVPPPVISSHSLRLPQTSIEPPVSLHHGTSSMPLPLRENSPVLRRQQSSSNIAGSRKSPLKTTQTHNKNDTGHSRFQLKVCIC